MKRFGLTVAAFIVVLGLSSCQKSFDQPSNSIDGTYVGTLTFTENLKSGRFSTNGMNNGQADVTNLGDGQIAVHLYGGEMDSTFTLNYYDNHDSVMVCLNGEAFDEMYEHMMGDSIYEGMMGDSIDYNEMMGDSTYTGGMMGGSNGGMMGGSNNNSNGGMMGGNGTNNTAWTNHMNTRHTADDLHFGGFDMNNGTFEYTMTTSTGEYHFKGSKRK